jgi:hypothetical protein
MTYSPQATRQLISTLLTHCLNREQSHSLGSNSPSVPLQSRNLWLSNLASASQLKQIKGWIDGLGGVINVANMLLEATSWDELVRSVVSHWLTSWEFLFNSAQMFCPVAWDELCQIVAQMNSFNFFVFIFRISCYKCRCL